MAVTQLGAPTSFTAGTTIVAADVNSNFTAIRSAFNALVTATDQLAGGLNINGKLYINDTANANNTIGVTINQGANDDHILTLKSNDVATGLTTAPTGTVETDDFAALFKTSATLGGLTIQSFAEDAALTAALVLESYGGTADTTKSTAGRGLVEVYATEHDGANALSDIAADGNVFVVRARVGAADRTLLIVDEDGDIHNDGGNNLLTFDSYEDAKLVRAFSVATSPDKIIRSEWDRFVQYNEDDLVRAGILGAPRAEGGMVNMSQLTRLLVGACWQQECRINDLERKLLPA